MDDSVKHYIAATFTADEFIMTVSDTINPLMGTLKPHSNGPLYSNTVIGTLAVDGWAVTFGTAKRGLDGLRPRPSPPRCTKCNSPPINGQCTKFIFSTWHYNCLCTLKGQGVNTH